ncbi:Protein GVQW1 [Plecturocebus cupreus]
MFSSDWKGELEEDAASEHIKKVVTCGRSEIKRRILLEKQPLSHTAQSCGVRSLTFQETEFHNVGQAGLELLASSDLPALASQSAEIKGVSHHTWPHGSLVSLNARVTHREAARDHDIMTEGEKTKK